MCWIGGLDGRMVWIGETNCLASACQPFRVWKGLNKAFRVSTVRFNVTRIFGRKWFWQRIIKLSKYIRTKCRPFQLRLLFIEYIYIYHNIRGIPSRFVGNHRNKYVYAFTYICLYPIANFRHICWILSISPQKPDKNLLQTTDKAEPARFRLRFMIQKMFLYLEYCKYMYVSICIHISTYTYIDFWNRKILLRISI